MNEVIMCSPATFPIDNLSPTTPIGVLAQKKTSTGVSFDLLNSRSSVLS
jgi:hypothetical protein